jgi:hypothetical protein
MGKIHGNMIASIGLIVFSQTAFAALDSRVATVTGNSVPRNMLRLDVSENDANGSYRLVQAQAQPQAQPQASEPKSSATPPLPDSKGPNAPPAPAASSPPGTITATAIKSAPSVPGCALHYLAAEVSGKLKGRKWKQFRQEECGESETSAVFPTTVAPKYSAEKPEKARTLTCADQFTANKATNANGGLKWIEKSGGYYSECIVRLKG